MRIPFAAAVALALFGCSLVPPDLREVPIQDPEEAVELTGTPFFPQEQHQCGPAALATVLLQAGAEVTPEGLAAQVYLPGRKGSLQVELLGATRRQGLVPYPIAPELPALGQELRAGRPVLVLLDLGIPVYPIWHYAVVVGHEPKTRAVILRSASNRRKVMSERRFLTAWGRGGNWGLVVLRHGELPAAPDRSRYLDAVTALEAVGQFQAAEAAYRAALGAWPDDPLALLGIGNSRYGSRDLEGAAVVLIRLVTRHPNSIPAYNNLAQVLAEQGQRRQALATIAQGLNLTPKGHPLRHTLEATQAEIVRGMGAARPGRS